MTTQLPTTLDDCGELRGDLAAYADGESDASTAERIRDHLRGCPACLAKVGADASLNQTFRALASEPAPSALWGRIMAGLDEVERRQRRQADRQSRSMRWAVLGGSVASLALVAAVAVWTAIAPSTNVVNASVQDFITYRARGWTVDHAARDGRSLAAWAQARVAFAVPEIKERIGGFEIGGVRLCWLLDRRLLGVTYIQGADHAVVYVMEADGLALPTADRHLAGGIRASIHHYKGHGAAIWTHSDLVFVLVAAEKDFERLLEVAAYRSWGSEAQALIERNARHRAPLERRNIPRPSQG